ncbi:MAG: hypothetical protein KF906_12970 [Actinobacteria bacterium]|nr:hypothetical protein [Actinomycetota bacterium]
MRFSRLVIEADAQQALSLSMHERLTVIAGVAPEVRKVLCDELIGALGSTRSGVHLELVDDKGGALTVFRPSSGPHRVLDVGNGDDVSDDYRAEDGRIDLLAWHGLDERRSRDLLYFDRSDVGRDGREDAVVNRLADIDQGLLWSAASRVRITEEELQEITSKVAPMGDEVVSKIERRHSATEVATEQAMRIQRLSTGIAVLAFGLTFPMWYLRPESALPMLAVGVISLVFALLYRARVEANRRAERSALAEAGADSYLGYMVSQVNEMFDDTEQRKRAAAMAEDHRSAAVHWTKVAGDVSVEWALAHHDEIQATAQLRRQLRTLGRVSTGSSEVDERALEVAHALVTHLARVKRAGRANESLPLVLDDPFGSLPEETRIELLELVERTSGPPQVILLTDDPAIASWARPRALSGDLDLVEPGRAESNRDEVAV